MEWRLGRGQISHLLKFIDMAVQYVSECDGKCDSCPIGIETVKYPFEAPPLPEGTTICKLFDYIRDNAMYGNVAFKHVQKEQAQSKRVKKCINPGKEHMTCVLAKTDKPTFVISLECVECIKQGKQVKSG